MGQMHYYLNGVLDFHFQVIPSSRQSVWSVEMVAPTREPDNKHAYLLITYMKFKDINIL